MKTIKRTCAFCIAVCAIVALLTISVSADEGSLWSSGTVKLNDEPPLSLALYVIAEQNDMAVAGINGNVLNFSADRFACAMNLSSVKYITVNVLPDVRCGSLYIGGTGVSKGQKISAADIGRMVYEEASSGIGQKASFEFSVNGSPYSIKCNVYMIDGINYSPTVSLASYALLNTETYKNIPVSGVLSAYDPEGDVVRYEIVKYPENGVLVVNERTTGTYTYTPAENYTGDDSFKYVVRDEYGNYSSANEVKITVKASGVSLVYSDLAESELQSHAISMTEKGLMNGLQIGENYYFQPEREVTRAEFLITAMNAIGIKNVPAQSTTVFADDSDISSEMKGYIALAHSMGYISGKTVEGKTYFMPDEVINVSEAAVIVSNMIGYAQPKVTPVFADADKIPAWSGKAIESLHTLGILELPEMISGANEKMTRGAMAKMLNKTIFVISEHK